MKKKLLLVLCLMVFVLCGCMSRTEKRRLDKITLEAVQYMEDKYNKSFEIQTSNYVLLSSVLFSTYSDDIYVTLTDGTKVLYSSKDANFYDDYQAKDISLAIMDKIWNPLLEKLSPYKFQDTHCDIQPSFNFYNEEGLKGNFFHEYYNGDIEKYLKIEEVDFSLGCYTSKDKWYNTDLYIISNDKNSWQDRFDIVNKTFQSNMNSSINLVALTPKLYEEEVIGKEYPNINIGMVDCWATGNLKKLKVQNYIKIIDGVYVTSAEDNFVLEDGDILLKEIMKSDELQTIIDKVVEKKEQSDDSYINQEKYKYFINSLTPVYELEFSDRIKDRYKKYNKRSMMNVYISLDVKELNISEDNNLYKYSTRKINDYYQSYVAAYGNTLNGDYDVLDVFKENYNNYYWIGTQVKEEIIR